MGDMNTIQKITGLKRAAIDARTKKIADFKSYWDSYNAYLEQKNIPWKSQLSLKETFRAIDTIKPYYTETMFGNGDPFGVIPTAKEHEQSAASIQKLITYYLEKGEMYLPIEDFVTEMLIYGTAFSKLIWDKRTTSREVTEELPMIPAEDIAEEDFDKEALDTPASKMIKRKITVTKNAPALFNVTYKDIFFSPTARNLQEDTWIIHRTWRTFASLKKEDDEVYKATGQHKYKNLSNLKRQLVLSEKAASVGQNKSVDSEQQIAQEEFSAMGINNPTAAESKDPITKDGSDELELLEYWDRFGVECITVAGGLQIIKKMKNPYTHGMKPFLYANFVRRPNTVWGIGVAELARDGQALLDTAVNQGIDSNTLANNLMLLVSSESNFDPSQAKARPGGAIIVDTDGQPIGNVIQQLQFHKVNVDSEIALGKNEVETTTGANAFAQGTYQSGAVRSGEQQAQLMNASNNKFSGKIMTFDNMFLKPFIKMFYSLAQQFVNDETAITIIGRNGPEYVKVSPEDIAGDYMFYSKGARLISKRQQSIHEINNFLAVVGAIPDSKQVVNFRYLITKMWENMSNDYDTSQVILPDFQSDQFQEQAMMENMGQGTNPDIGQGGAPNPGGGLQV